MIARAGCKGRPRKRGRARFQPCVRDQVGGHWTRQECRGSCGVSPYDPGLHSCCRLLTPPLALRSPPILTPVQVHLHDHDQPVRLAPAAAARAGAGGGDAQPRHRLQRAHVQRADERVHQGQRAGPGAGCVQADAGGGLQPQPGAWGVGRGWRLRVVCAYGLGVQGCGPWSEGAGGERRMRGAGGEPTST